MNDARRHHFGTRTAAAALAAFSLLAGAALAAPAAEAATRASRNSALEGRWLHVRVESRDGDSGGPETVKVNLPLSMMNSVIPYLKEQALQETGGDKADRIELGDHDYDMQQLRALWEAAKESGNAEFVTVESEGENVRVAREGAFFLIKVRGEAREDHPGESVDVKIPIDVVDALFSGPGNDWNIEGALAALARHDGSDLILVNDGDDHVRIWIDGSGSGN